MITWCDVLSVQCTLNIQAELSRFLGKEDLVLSEITTKTILLQLAGKKEQKKNSIITPVNTLRLSLCFSSLSSTLSTVSALT